MIQNNKQTVWSDDLDKLMTNIIDVIKEEQIKLGYQKERIRLYYPLSSLNILLATSVNSEQMKNCLKEYFLTKVDIFGEVEISYKADRFCINLPEEATEYVYKHTAQTGFLYDFIYTIEKHEITIEDVISVFHKYSDAVYFEEMKESEFDYLIYFENGEPDAYRYCLTREGHHIIYHRYTIEDYEELFA